MHVDDSGACFGRIQRAIGNLLRGYGDMFAFTSGIASAGDGTCYDDIFIHVDILSNEVLLISIAGNVLLSKQSICPLDRPI
jgi:hypothetical protein